MFPLSVFKLDLVNAEEKKNHTQQLYYKQGCRNDQRQFLLTNFVAEPDLTAA
ncbi:MAG: hypothetical protein ACI9G1_004581 [Pirellulaceae bacterium]|jgi:hypothetical protein